MQLQNKLLVVPENLKMAYIYSSAYRFTIEGLIVKELIISTAAEMASAQKKDDELGNVREWVKKKEQCTADKFATLSPCIKCSAEKF